MRTLSDRGPTAPAPNPNASRTPVTAADLEPLIPIQPPGRITRKARHYVPQIVRLRDQGYTLEAIQQALAAVGVQVSISTVRREAMRPVPSATWFEEASPPSPPPAPDATAPPAVAVAPPPNVCISGPSSGKDLAEAFARSRNANPLVRAKEQSP